MKKLFIKADIYNELIEKGYGKRDLSKLTRKVITDKNGHRRTVFVRNDVQTTKTKKPTANTMEDFIYKDMKQFVSKYETDDLMHKRVNNMNIIDKYEKMFSKMADNGINAKKDRPDLYEHYAAAKGELRAIVEELDARDKQRLENAKKPSSSEHDKDYYNFIEYLNGYDRTDSDEKEKYAAESERLKNKFPKEQMAKYFENAKERLSGSKEDIKKYLDSINIKNASNANYFIAEQTYQNLTGKEYSKTFSDYVDKLNTEDMAEEIYNDIHFKGKEREEKRQNKNTSVGDAALNEILSNDFLMKNKVFREDEYTKRGVTKDDTGANGLRYFSPIQWNDNISKMPVAEKTKLANEMRKMSDQLRKHTDKMADSKLKNLLESWETSLYKDAWALSH